VTGSDIFSRESGSKLFYFCEWCECFGRYRTDSNPSKWLSSVHNVLFICREQAYMMPTAAGSLQSLPILAARIERSASNSTTLPCFMCATTNGALSSSRSRRSFLKTSYSVIVGTTRFFSLSLRRRAHRYRYLPGTPTSRKSQRCSSIAFLFYDAFIDSDASTVTGCVLSSKIP